MSELQIITDRLNMTFKENFGSTQNTFLFFAPGRVNLIGEHIDYNGGRVLPCALDLGTYALVQLRSDQKASFVSLNFDLKLEIPLADLKYSEEDDWINFPKAIISQLQKKFEIKSGFNVAYYGNIPNGAGLSSSASIEMVTAFFINHLFNFKISKEDLAVISQKAENEFIGVNCGIMDQFSIGVGKKDNAISLNCETLDYEYVAFQNDNYDLLIVNSGKRRELADSKYNERFSECQNLLEIINSEYRKICNLCELKKEELTHLKGLLKDKENGSVLFKRLRHVVTENWRVEESLKNLNAGNFNYFGKLLNESHQSLKQDYEVTGFELDTLVHALQRQDGVLGSRMTGAGFGGCCLALVEKSKVNKVIKNAGEEYSKMARLVPEFYSVQISDGVRLLIA